MDTLTYLKGGLQMYGTLDKKLCLHPKIKLTSQCMCSMELQNHVLKTREAYLQSSQTNIYNRAVLQKNH